MKTAIILGNGPSLQKLLDFGLENIPKHIDTIGLNSFYRYSEKIKWYPTYIGSFDVRVTPYHFYDMVKYVENSNVKKFVCCDWALEYAKADEEYYTHPKIHREKNQNGFNPEWYVDLNNMSCSGNAACKFLMKEGYTKIYLIGVDANYVDFIDGSKRDEGGGLIMDKTPEKNPNYFWDEYQVEGDEYNVPGKRGHILSWQETAHNVKKYKPNIEIINLSDISEVQFFKFSTIEKEFKIK